MAEIIRFPQKLPPREAALRRMAAKLVAHMTVVFFERRILHIPVQAYIDDMLGILTRDRFDYTPDVIDEMGDDSEFLLRFERKFIAVLVECGHLPREMLLTNF